MKNKITIIIVLFVVLVVGGALATYRYFNEAASVTTVVTEMNIDATQLVNDYTSDESAANGKYLDKTMQVSGKAGEINIDGDNSFVEIMVPDSDSKVRCTFDNENSVLLYNISEGMTVEITGVCKGFSSDEELDLLGGSDVILTECLLDGYYN
jgi:hypothetical protein